MISHIRCVSDHHDDVTVLRLAPDGDARLAVVCRTKFPTQKAYSELGDLNLDWIYSCRTGNLPFQRTRIWCSASLMIDLCIVGRNWLLDLRFIKVRRNIGIMSDLSLPSRRSSHSL